MRTAGWLIIFSMIIAMLGCGRRESREEMIQQCQGIREENAFWKVMSGADPTTIPDTSGSGLGIVAYLMISPLAEIENAAAAMLRYEAYQAFKEKSGYFLTKTESEEITEILIFSKSPGERADAFRRLVEADQKASDFLHARLADRERMDAFIRGEKIPPIPEPNYCECLLRKTAIRAD
jgi:hypothetical protein